MKAYYFDNQEGDQRRPHESDRPVSEAHLSRLGIFHTRCSAISEVDSIAKDRKYNHRDEITISPTAMGEIYESKVKAFFNEHLHEDEEIRYIMEGSGFFDVRSEGDDWIRLWMHEGDLICLPAGIYHRFTTDEKDYIKAMRLFKDNPSWTPLNRGPDLDDNKYRVSYLEMRDDPTQLEPGEQPKAQWSDDQTGVPA